MAAASVRHSESSGLECTIYYPDLIFLRSESMCVTVLEVCVLGLYMVQGLFSVGLGLFRVGLRLH